MNRMYLFAWAVVGAFALTTVSLPVAADEAADREKLISTAESTLDKMTNEIKGFEKDANAQDTVDAVKLSVGLTKIIADLKKVQGDDDQAQDMVEKWPGHVKAFQAAGVRLAKLKNLQLALEKAAPDECKKEQRQLDDVIKKFLPSHDPDGMLEIPKAARSVGSKASAMMSNAKGAVKMADVTVREASGFGASGEWSALSSAVKNAAKGMHRDITDKQKSINDSCDELAMGDKNPVVVNARKEIAKETGSELATLQTMVDNWEKKAAGFFKTDCVAMERLANAYCGIDAGDDDSKSDVDRLKSEVDKIVREVKDDNKDLTDELADIRKMAADLSEEKTMKDSVGKIVKEMDDELKKIARLQKAGAMAGFRHPAVQFYIKFGKQMHDRMEASYSCDVRDVPYPGSSKRPDCVRAKGCMIFEFKPDSSGAKSKGVGQLRTYKGLVETYYNKVLAGKEKVNSKYGGPAIMQAFEKAGCVKGSSIKMGTKLATYNRCQVKYQCEK